MALRATGSCLGESAKKRPPHPDEWGAQAYTTDEQGAIRHACAARGFFTPLPECALASDSGLCMRSGTSSMVPPALAMASRADCENRCALMVSFFVKDPLPRIFTPSQLPLTRPCARSAVSSMELPAGSPSSCERLTTANCLRLGELNPN